MNSFDMKDYISAIQESCSNLKSSWENDATIDVGCLAEIKQKLNHFMVEHKNEIMTCFNFAESKGKYKSINIPDILSIIEKFDEYFMDLNAFMREMIDIDGGKPLDKKQIETIQRASGVDECFYKETFPIPVPVLHTTFANAMNVMESLLHIDVMIGDFSDIYIELMNLENSDNDKMRLLADLYTKTTVRFLNRVIEELIKTISILISVKNGGESGLEEKRIGEYRLI